MAAERATWTGLVLSEARCETCGWECYTANAQGLGAQHSDRHGHTVHVDMARATTYTPRGSDYDTRMLAHVEARKGG